MTPGPTVAAMIVGLCLSGCGGSRTNSSGSSSSSGVSPSLSGTTSSTAVGQPRSFSASSIAGTTLTLSWSNPTDPQRTSYEIERCSGINCSISAYAPLNASVVSTATTEAVGDTTPATDTALSVDTYYSFRIRALTTNTSYQPSSWVYVTNVKTLNPPRPPSALRLTDLKQTRLGISWTNQAYGAIYDTQVYRCSGTQCDCRPTGTGALVSTTSPANAATGSYADTGLSTETVYRYCVRTVDTTAGLEAALQNSDWLVSDDIKTFPDPPTPQGALTLAATASSTATRVTLSWNGLTTAWPSTRTQQRLYYRIYRGTGAACTASNSDTLVTSVSIAAGTNAGVAATYTDSGLTPSTEYCYAVYTYLDPNPFQTPLVAPDGAYSTALTPAGTITTAAAGISLSSFTVTATTASSITTSIDWLAPAAGDSVQLQSCTGFGCTNYSTVTTVTYSADPQTYTFTGLSPQTYYSFKAIPYRNGGTTASTTLTNRQTNALPRTPKAFTYGRVTSSSVEFRWTNPSQNAGTPTTTYSIERCTGVSCATASWSTIANNISHLQSSYWDTGLSSATTYTYRLRASNTNGTSSYLTSDSISTLGSSNSLRQTIVALKTNNPAGTAINSSIREQSIVTMNQSGSTLFVGGFFDRIGKTTGPLAFFNPISTTPGELPSGYGFHRLFSGQNTSATTDGYVVKVISDGGTGYFVAGNFAYYAGVSVGPVVHLKADFSLDTTWGTANTWTIVTAGWGVRDLLLDGNKLIVVGSVNVVAGAESAAGIIALTASTGALSAWSSDTTYSFTGTPATISKMGSLYVVGGNFTAINGTARTNIGAIDAATGAVDATWAPAGGADNTVWTLKVLNDSIFVGGAFTTLGGVAATSLGKISISDSSSVTAIGASCTTCGGSALVRSLDTSGDTLYIGGHFDTIGTTTGYSNLGSFNTVSATALTSWQPQVYYSAVGDATGTVYTLDLDSTGNVYFGGTFQRVGSNVRYNAAGVNSSGTILSWDPGADSTVHGISVFTDNHISVGGDFNFIGGSKRGGIAAFSVTDSQILPWRCDLDLGTTTAEAVQAIEFYDDRIYLGGTFTGTSNICTNQSTVGSADYLIALNQDDATMVSSFAPAPDSNVYALQRFNDDLIVGGTFATLSGSARQRIGAISAVDGTTDSSWTATAIDNNAVTHLKEFRSTLLIGGTFTTVNGGTAQARLVAFSLASGSMGTHWSNWDAHAIGGSLLSMDLDPRDYSSLGAATLYAGGGFTSLNGLGATGLAAIRVPTADAAAAAQAWPNAGCAAGTGGVGTVKGISVSDDGVWFAGTFSTLCGSGAEEYVAYRPFSYSTLAQRGVAVSTMVDTAIVGTAGVRNVYASGVGGFLLGDFSQIQTVYSSGTLTQPQAGSALVTLSPVSPATLPGTSVPR